MFAPHANPTHPRLPPRHSDQLPEYGSAQGSRVENSVYWIFFATNTSYSLFLIENVWILTRKRRPSRRIKRKALRALRALGVGRTAKLIKSDQVNLENDMQSSQCNPFSNKNLCKPFNKIHRKSREMFLLKIFFSKFESSNKKIIKIILY